MSEIELHWQPPPHAGAIVNIVVWRDMVVIACERGVYLMDEVDAPPRPLETQP